MERAAPTRNAERMRKRSRFDALQPVEKRTWLTVTTMAGELLRSQPLDPLTNLRLVLDNELERMQAEGWFTAEPHSSACAAFFAERDGVRVGVTVVSLEPGTPPPKR
jgi:hypothetical protein